MIVPVLNEQENLRPFYQRMCAVAGSLGPHEIEMVFVDDGSTDDSPRLMLELAEHDPRVRVIRLSRNFGSHAAAAAGFQHALGEAMAVLSVDMQDPPELLKPMVERWMEGYDTVWAVRESRDDPPVGKVFSAAFYRLIRRLALPQIPLGGMDVCLVSRQVIESVRNLDERNTSIFFLIMWAGFGQCFIPYHREARKAGRSKWSIGKKIKLLIDSFVAFSFFPIRLISYLGMAISLLGFLYAAFVIGTRLFSGHLVPGWASLMVVVLLLAGVQLIMLGIVSEYLWRTFDEARRRPLYIVRETHGFPAKAERRADSCAERDKTLARS